MLSEFQKYDPGGMAFRYSIDRKAKKALTDPDLTFEMDHVSQTMERTLEFLANLKSELDWLNHQEILRSEGL